jgi:hypothetical protein
MGRQTAFSLSCRGAGSFDAGMLRRDDSSIYHDSVASDDFATTRWSLVLSAGARETPDSREALGHLCRLYWYPLYAYVRRRGFAGHQAQDVIQGFFARLIEKNAVSAADAQRGRFRSFLLGCLNNYLANERDREVARRRNWEGRSSMPQPWTPFPASGFRNSPCKAPSPTAR